MRVYIKNMVCVRCSLVVRTELEKLGFRFISVSPGELEISDEQVRDCRGQLRVALRNLGMELIEDRESIIIEQIKTAIITLVSDSEELIKVKLSDYLSSKLGYSYQYLSTIFSTVHGSSVERFYISQRIERVKEMLVHEKLSFSEIAYRAHFSSVAHLSAQFKKETGLTLTQFRRLKHEDIN